MAEWGFWEWLTYGCIGVAALMLALDTAVKQSPDLNARFGRLLATRLWAFTPFALILVSALVIAFQHLGHSASRKAPITTETNQTPQSDIGAQENPATGGGPGKRVFVGFGPEYLMEMDKKNTGAESEAILKLYAGKWMKIQNEKFSGAARENPEIGSLINDRYVTISVKTAGEYVVMCKIKDSSQMETAMTLRPGTPISFVGMITQQQMMLRAILSLDPCELTSF